MTLDDLHDNTGADGYDPNLDHQIAAHFVAFDKEVAKRAGWAALPLQISHGEHRGPTNGYGIRHILLGHGEELAKDGWYSVQDFVNSVIEQFDAVCKDDRPNRWLLVRVAPTSADTHWMLVIELDKSGAFYRIITGWLREGYRKLKNAVV